MTIRAIRDRDSWRACLQGMAAVNPYQTWDYVQADAERDGHDFALYEVTGEGGRLAVPLLIRPILVQGERVGFDGTSPYGYPGIAHDRSAPAVRASLCTQLRDHLKALGLVSCILRLNPFDPLEADLEAVLGVSTTSDVVWLDLTQTEDELLAQCRDTTLFHHRRFLKRSPTWHERTDSGDFLSVYFQTMRRLGASEAYFFPQAYFERLSQTTDFEVRYFENRVAGELAASFCTMSLEGIAYYHLSASSSTFLRLAPTKHLILATALQLKARGERVLNLGGGAGTNEDGLFHFKAGFSHLRAPYVLGRMICDPEKYSRLVQARPEVVTESRYFPAYREPGAVLPVPAGRKGLNVLMTSAGRRVTLMQAFQLALQPLGGQVVVAERDALAPTCVLADAAVRVPAVSDSAYLSNILRLIQLHDIGLIVPTIDTELMDLALHAEAFLRFGARALISTPNFIRICADKWETAQTFAAEGVAVPVSWLPDALPEQLPEEVFIKPRDGSASVDAHPCRREDLHYLLPRVPHAIVQERLHGTEITVDALLDFEGRLLHFVPRARIRTLGGESIQGITLDAPEVDAWLQPVLEACGRLGARGPVTLQAFRTVKGLVLTEINPRFGGGFPLALAAGGDYPEWVLALQRGETVPPRLGQYKRGLMMTRYYSESFLERLPWEN